MLLSNSCQVIPNERAEKQSSAEEGKKGQEGLHVKRKQTSGWTYTDTSSVHPHRQSPRLWVKGHTGAWRWGHNRRRMINTSSWRFLLTNNYKGGFFSFLVSNPIFSITSHLSCYFLLVTQHVHKDLQMISARFMDLVLHHKDSHHLILMRVSYLMQSAPGSLLNESAVAELCSEALKLPQRWINIPQNNNSKFRAIRIVRFSQSTERLFVLVLSSRKLFVFYCVLECLFSPFNLFEHLIKKKIALFINTKTHKRIN